jgi:hypothetical protein
MYKVYPVSLRVARKGPTHSPADRIINLTKGAPSDVYADPLLIAQAKIRGVIIISQETRSGNPKTPKLPNVADDPQYGVKVLTLWELANERRWQFR